MGTRRRGNDGAVSDARPTPTELPEAVLAAAGAWLAAHDEHAPRLIEGLYVVGSAALGDHRPGSDLDVVATTADPATDDDVERLRRAANAARDELAVLAPDGSGVSTVDGPIVTWSDLASPPLAVLRPWTLDGELRFDGDCFEINPITWYVLDRYGVALRGSPAAALGVSADEAERVRWVVANVDTYWRGVHAQVLAEIPARPAFPAEVVEWCVLGIARMAYTFETGDVTSKSGAGRWAASRLPGFAEAFERAIEIRRRHDPAEVGERPVAEEAATVLGELVSAITA